jgi:hypothetical protein
MDPFEGPFNQLAEEHLDRALKSSDPQVRQTEALLCIALMGFALHEKLEEIEAKLPDT